MTIKIGEIELSDWVAEGDPEHQGVSHVRKIIGRKPNEDYGVAINKDNRWDGDNCWDIWNFREMNDFHDDWTRFLKSKGWTERSSTLEAAKTKVDEFLRWMKLRSFE